MIVRAILARVKMPAWVVALVVAFIGVIFYWPVLSGGRSFYLTDISDFFEPLTRYIADRIRGGGIPLWNPYLYCGMPQIAVQSPSICYLPTWIFVFFDFNRGLALMMIFIETTAAVGAFLLAREHSFSRTACLFAATLAGFNGFIFSLDTNWTLAAGVSWLPWLMLYIKRLGTAGGARNVAILSLLVYLFITTGRPEVVIPGAALMFAFWLLAVRAKLLHFLAATTLGILLSMPMLLPALEWLPLSRRAMGLDPRESLLLSANWYDLLNIVLFPIFGDQRLTQSPQVQSGGSLLVASSFLGPIPVIAALAGLRPWTAGLGLVGILLTTALIPMSSLFRFPIKLMWIVLLALIAAATKTIDRAGERKAACIVLGISLFALIANACLIGRHWTDSDFFEAPSVVHNVPGYRVTGLYHRHNFMEPAWIQGSAAVMKFDRQALYPNSNIDYAVPSAGGFEGACTGEYYQTFYSFLANSTQSTGLMPDAHATKDDEPLAKLMNASASAITISQLKQNGPAGVIAVPELDSRWFELIESDEHNNLRYYKTKFVQPRIRIDQGSVEVLTDLPETIRVRTNTNANTANIIVADQFYPGWRATIDGAPIAIDRHNKFFRSITVPAGQHTVEMLYDPLSWKAGILCAALASIIIAAMLIIPHRWSFLS